MDSKKIRKSPVVFHPFFFAIFQILFLYANNIGELTFRVITLPLLAALVFALILLCFFYFIYRNVAKAGIITTLSLLLFFTFGHVYYAIMDLLNIPLNTGKLRYFLLAYILLFFVGFFTLFKIKKDLKYLNHILTIISGFLVTFSLVQITFYNLARKPEPRFSSEIRIPHKIDVERANLPDIYYIVPDAYSNDYVLKEIFNYDNSDFTNHLARKGFFVAKKSKCNFVHTSISLASSLNMEYINYLSESLGEDSGDVNVLHKMIRNSKILNFVKSLGYKFINFSSSWGGTDHLNRADLNVNVHSHMNEFTMILMYTTILKVFDRFINKREKILKTFVDFPSVVKMKAPKFVLAHMLTPHPPNVFDESGKPVPGASTTWVGWESEKDFIGEIKFLNKKLKELIDQILSNSDTPPVIIIQGDHGPAFKLKDLANPSQKALLERTGILNALLISPECRKNLYDSITPVNTFRIVFNCYFGAELEILADETYWSVLSRPYDLKKVTVQSTD